MNEKNCFNCRYYSEVTPAEGNCPEHYLNGIIHDCPKWKPKIEEVKK